MDQMVVVEVAIHHLPVAVAVPHICHGIPVGR